MPPSYMCTDAKCYCRDTFVSGGGGETTASFTTGGVRESGNSSCMFGEQSVPRYLSLFCNMCIGLKCKQLIIIMMSHNLDVSKQWLRSDTIIWHSTDMQYLLIGFTIKTYTNSYIMNQFEICFHRVEIFGSSAASSFINTSNYES